MLIFSQVSSGEADAGIGGMALVLYENRNFGIEYSFPVSETDLFLLASKPRPVRPLYNLLRPFSGLVWLTIATIYGLAILTLVLLFLSQSAVLADGRQRPSKTRLFAESALLAFGCLCSQGSSQMFKMVPTHVSLTE